MEGFKFEKLWIQLVSCWLRLITTTTMALHCTSDDVLSF